MRRLRPPWGMNALSLVLTQKKKCTLSSAKQPASQIDFTCWLIWKSISLAARRSIERRAGFSQYYIGHWIQITLVAALNGIGHWIQITLIAALNGIGCRTWIAWVTVSMASADTLKFKKFSSFLLFAFNITTYIWKIFKKYVPDGWQNTFIMINWQWFAYANVFSGHEPA